MRCRKIVDSDVPLIADWFADKRWEMPPVENLLKLYGLMYEDQDGNPIACCWVYLTETPVAYLAWFGANPSLSDEQQADGVKHLVYQVQDAISNATDVKLLLYYTQNEALAQKFEGLGFRTKKRFIQCSWMPKN